jgi:glycosyltransferase involved in cell wall biosynthesis
MLSVVVPVYNAKEYVEQMIASLFATTKSDFELIIIDDFSTDSAVKEFIEGLESPEVNITKIFNTEHKWTNYNWNLGVRLSNGEHVAILNSDIVLSKDWDVPLIEALQEATIACPIEIKSNKEKTFKQELHPLVAQVDSQMINGSAFMFKMEDVNKLFPIPFNLKHWCGDNWLADMANSVRGVKFAHDSTFKHFSSRSAITIPREQYVNRVMTDLDEYEKLSDRSMEPIRARIENAG